MTYVWFGKASMVSGTFKHIVPNSLVVCFHTLFLSLLVFGLLIFSAFFSCTGTESPVVPTTKLGFTVKFSLFTSLPYSTSVSTEVAANEHEDV